LIVTCGEGALEVLRVRPAGKNEMDADAWWRGLRNAPDETPRFTPPRLEEQ
jgi:methionyl-tRNA formyltransferase